MRGFYLRMSRGDDRSGPELVEGSASPKVDPHRRGNAAEDGYTVTHRRPRVAGDYDIMGLDDADRIESFHKADAEYYGG